MALKMFMASSIQIVPILIALVTSAIATELSIRFSRTHHLFDEPNGRSSHTSPTPRLGGIGIALGVLAGAITYHATIAIALQSTLLITMAMFGVVGLVDDLRSLQPKSKYLGQLAATTFFIVFSTRSSHLPWFSIPLILFWVTGFTNAFNFMDGINGLCGGTGILYSVFLSLIAIRQQDTASAGTGFLLAAACAGFLPHNFPRARTFMGDTGSMLIGAGLSVLSVRLVCQGKGSAAVSLLLVFAAFLYDTSFTIFRRIRRGENILQAHRTHLYQRLVRAGRSHADVSMLYFACHLGLGMLGLMSFGRSGLFVSGATLIGAGLLVLLTLHVYRFEKRAPALTEERSSAAHA